ncbi:hypothetical protein Dimus_028021 [Dionaea muscipula]
MDHMIPGKNFFILFPSPMTTLSSHTLSSIPCYLSLHSSSSSPEFLSHPIGNRTDVTGRFGSSRFTTASSIQSNPKILKTNRRSPYGKEIYVDDIDEELCGERDDVPWFADPDEEFAEPTSLDADGQRSKLLIASNTRREQIHRKRVSRLKRYGIEELEGNNYDFLSAEIGIKKAWIPLLDYLRTFGLNDWDLIRIYERRKRSFQVNVCSAKERLEYLLGLGVNHNDMRRILLRQPQILECTVENLLKSRVAFLVDLGIPNSRIGKVITAAPSICTYGVESSLKPTVDYLVQEVGIKERDLSKVIQLSPQILVQRVEITWNDRYAFLSKELRAPRDSIVKMITKHPQLLHYSIQDGLLPRIKFLRSIGMQNTDILKVLTSLSQVFSLSVEGNLRPKYLYLINELQNEVKSLTKYPTYLSLSLAQRIRPRHRFLVFLKKTEGGPFPLRSLVLSDECFCEKWAGTSTKEYLAFRQRLLLQDFADKYRKRR